METLCFHLLSKKCINSREFQSNAALNVVWVHERNLHSVAMCCESHVRRTKIYNTTCCTMKCYKTVNEVSYLKNVTLKDKFAHVLRIRFVHLGLPVIILCIITKYNYSNYTLYFITCITCNYTLIGLLSAYIKSMN